VNHSAIIEQLLSLDTCAVSDALDSLQLPPAVTGLVPLTIHKKVAGKVVTVLLGPEKPPITGQRHLGTAAIEAADNGDIIAIEHSSGAECAGWGGVLSVGAQLNGVVGVIIDGPARDIDEARELGFPVYGRSPIARTARGRVYEQDFNCSIRIGDVQVNSGDYVLADGSGVAFISAGHIEDTLRQAKRISDRERLMIEALQRGEQITEVVGRDYETMLDQSK